MKISHLLESEDSRDFGETIYHGSMKAKKGVYHTQIRREKPMSTFLPVHRMLSKLSEEKLGINVRSLLFASMTIGRTTPYGKQFELIPLGNNYRVYVNDGITDMTMHYRLSSFDVRNQVLDVLESGVYDDFINRDVVIAASDTLKDIQRGNIEANDLEETYYHLQETLKEILINQGHDEFVENGFKIIMEEIANVFQLLEKHIHEYIDGIKVVKTASEIENKGSELMLFLPDGFELKAVKG